VIILAWSCLAFALAVFFVAIWHVKQGMKDLKESEEAVDHYLKSKPKTRILK